MRPSSRSPRLSIGLPVHNGERYIRQALDAVLNQSYQDFELIISDNASTDRTAEICQAYAARDSRIRFLRQPRNVGLAPNHNFVVAQAAGELFKWAAGDDVYAPDLVERCVAALDAHPDAILAHSWTAMIDSSGDVAERRAYGLATASPRAPERFKSVLFDDGGDDIYGVVRRDVLLRVLPERSHHHSDRTLVTSLALQGRFVQVPDWLYMRRDHSQRAERACSSVRARCANMDPRRTNRVAHPVARLYGEYVWVLYDAVRRAPLTPEDRCACYGHLVSWLGSRVMAGARRLVGGAAASLQRAEDGPPRALVPIAGRMERSGRQKVTGAQV